MSSSGQQTQIPQQFAESSPSGVTTTFLQQQMQQQQQSQHLEVKSYKQHVNYALRCFSQTATIAVSNNESTCRTRYNLNKKLRDIPEIEKITFE